jgi:hypothetical protein
MSRQETNDTGITGASSLVLCSCTNTSSSYTSA